MTLPVPTSASNSAPTSSTLHTFSTTTKKTTPVPSVPASSSTRTTIHQLSIPLPDAPYTRLRIHLSILKTAIMLFLTTTTNIGDLGVGIATGEAHASSESVSKNEDEVETDPEERKDMGTESSGQTSRPATLVPMGSFVCAMPDLSNSNSNSNSNPHASNTSSITSSKQPLTTPLYPHPPSTLDFATRCARVLAHRLRRPTYVGNSISEMDLGMVGPTVGEMGLNDRGAVAGSAETSILKRVVDVVVEKVLDREGGGKG